jgi:hypothetical protein
MNPDNHFTQRNMPNLLDLKFNQTKINEVYHLELEFKIRFTVLNPCFTTSGEECHFYSLLHSIFSSPLDFLWPSLYKSQIANI